MKILLLAAVVLLAGCAGLQSSSGLTPPAVQRAVHRDRNGSSTSPNAKTIKMLLYIGDDETNDVYVYDYKSGKSAGTLTGFDEPYGECVDATGDIYISNYGSGNVVEYAHGGTTPINTYSPGGTPIGCAVDAKGDVAVTSFDPGEVTVFAGGNPSEGTTYSDSSCTYMWSMAYDLKGNLVGFGESGSGDPAVCALLAGSKTMTLITTKGFSTDFASGTAWDGRYFAIADELRSFQSGIVQATLKGKTLTYAGETTLSDNCYNDYVDIVNPFIVGKRNTPVNDKQGDALVGVNLWCVDGGKGQVGYWHYPGGGMPYKDLSGASADPYGVAVSIAP
jgi:hypothetical protein